MIPIQYIDDTQVARLKPGAKVRVVGNAVPFTHAQLRQRCEAVGLVWTQGDHPDILVLGMLGSRSRSWLGTGSGGFALARSIPTISDTALIEYLAQARRERRIRPARDLLASLPADKARLF